MNEEKVENVLKDIFKIVMTVGVGIVMFMLPVISYLFRQEYGVFPSFIVGLIWLLLFVLIFFDFGGKRRRKMNKRCKEVLQGIFLIGGVSIYLALLFVLPVLINGIYDKVGIESKIAVIPLFLLWIFLIFYGWNHEIKIERDT